VKTSCFVWKAVTRHRKNLIFLGLLNANGSPSCYMPLKALSPTPLYYPLSGVRMLVMSVWLTELFWSLRFARLGAIGCWT
jgi:hypothetical protein